MYIGPYNHECVGLFDAAIFFYVTEGEYHVMYLAA